MRNPFCSGKKWKDCR